MINHSNGGRTNETVISNHEANMRSTPRPRCWDDFCGERVTGRVESSKEKSQNPHPLIKQKPKDAAPKILTPSTCRPPANLKVTVRLHQSDPLFLLLDVLVRIVPFWPLLCNRPPPAG